MAINSQWIEDGADSVSDALRRLAVELGVLEASDHGDDDFTDSAEDIEEDVRRLKHLH